jgi:hypothetical protein
MRRFDTRLERPRVIEAAWDPLPMAAAHSASLSAPQGDALNVSVPSSKIGDLVQVRKRRLFAMPFYTQNGYFTKTGSGQTSEKLRKDGAFL